LAAFAPDVIGLPSFRAQGSGQDMADSHWVPNVTFKTRVRDESIGGENPFRRQDLTTDDVFGGKKIVLFALPGAFTPTRSSTHLPGYDAKYGEF
jgi:thioredoxin-dependent peroxiredoxin